MALAEARLSENHHKLMIAIGDVIARHTGKSPMTVEDIVGVLGFCAGAAIVKGERGFSERRSLREVAIGNVDQGMETMQRAMSGSSKIIIPGMVM